MRKTVLFAAALFTSVAATAMSIDLESIGMFEPYSPPSTAYLENTRSSWTLVMVPIDDRVPALTESPQLAWTEMVMQLPLKKTMSNSLDPWTDPDVGWSPGDIWMMNSYCNENYGHSLDLVDHHDVGIAWDPWRSDHFYVFKDKQIETGFNFSEQYGLSTGFPYHRLEQLSGQQSNFTSPSFMTALMWNFPASTFTDRTITVCIDPVWAPMPWRTFWYY